MVSCDKYTFLLTVFCMAPGDCKGIKDASCASAHLRASLHTDSFDNTAPSQSCLFLSFTDSSVSS